MERQIATSCEWQKIKLPESLLLKDQSGNCFYLGVADPRYEMLVKAQENEYQDILTYSHLGCGSFYKTPEGLWREGRFRITEAVLNMLITTPAEVRLPLYNGWKNLYTRNPKFIQDISFIKKFIPFTRDGMYLKVREKLTDEIRAELASEGFVIIPHDGSDDFFEDIFAAISSKSLKLLLLSLITDKGQNRTVEFKNTYGVLRSVYTDDQIEMLLRANPEACLRIRCSDVLLKHFGIKKVKRAIEGHNPDTAKLLTLRANPKVEAMLIDIMKKAKKRDSADMLRIFKSLETGIEIEPFVAQEPCIPINQDIMLRTPLDTIETYEWGEKIGNCLGTQQYYKKILSGQSMIYGVFENGCIVGSVECYRDRIAQVDVRKSNHDRNALSDQIRATLGASWPTVQLHFATILHSERNGAVLKTDAV